MKRICCSIIFSLLLITNCFAGILGNNKPEFNKRFINKASISELHKNKRNRNKMKRATPSNIRRKYIPNHNGGLDPSGKEFSINNFKYRNYKLND